MLTGSPPHAVWVPAARSLPRLAILAVLGASSTPTLYARLRGVGHLDATVVVASVIAGAATAFAFDEPSGAILDAAPVSRVRRVGVRLVLVGAAVALALAAVVLMAAGDGSVVHELPVRMAELAAAAGLSSAVSAWALRLQVGSSNDVGAVAGPLLVLVSSALAVRVQWLPTVGSSTDATRWWEAAVVAWTLALWNSRDPYR